MTKGQIAGQVFIYIMAVIVVGGIALIGYSAVKSIVSKSCDTEKIGFKADMESMIEKYTSYGSVNKKVMVAPCDYETICFVDKIDVGNSAFLCTNKIVEESVRNSIKQNIFVVSGLKTIGLGYSDMISLPTPGSCTCIAQRNKNFYITFNGQGATVAISESSLTE